MKRKNAEHTHAVVRTALLPVRADPEVRAEQVTQELLGAVLEILEWRGDWARIRGEDGYEGWVSVGGLLVCSRRRAEAWWDDAGGQPALVFDAALVDDAGQPVARLPWGARVAVAAQLAVLPDGRRGRLAEGHWLAWSELGERFPRVGAAVVATAREWMGVPYLWGGRTRWGTDCSGFVQAVYRVHGFLLPRDSYQQAEVGEPIDSESGFEGLEPGDLLFFRGADSMRVVHVALSLGGAVILHAAQANGYVMEDDLERDTELERSLAARWLGARRLFP